MPAYLVNHLRIPGGVPKPEGLDEFERLEATFEPVRPAVVGFQNRLLVLIRWSFSFATRGRGARLITSPANADAAGRPAAHPEPGSTLLMPPRVGSHPSQMR